MNSKDINAKKQKTLFHFFKKDACLDASNLICSACNIKLDNNKKLIWHKDFECKNRKIIENQKLINSRKNYKYSGRENKLKKVKQSSDRVKIITLDDSDVDDFEPMTGHSIFGNEKALNDDGEVKSGCRSPSFFSLNSRDSLSLDSLVDDNENESDASSFLLDNKNSLYVSKKQIESEDENDPLNLLRLDWSSPEKSQNKDDCIENYSVDPFDKLLNIGEDVDALFNEEATKDLSICGNKNINVDAIDMQVSQDMSKCKRSIIEKMTNLEYSTDVSHNVKPVNVEDSTSEDEFEISQFSFCTPEKQLQSFSQNIKNDPNSESEFESLKVSYRTPSKVSPKFKHKSLSPKISHKKNASKPRLKSKSNSPKINVNEQMSHMLNSPRFKALPVAHWKSIISSPQLSESLYSLSCSPNISPKLSATYSSCKAFNKTPRSTLKALKNTSPFKHAHVSPKHVMVKRKLDISEIIQGSQKNRISGIDNMDSIFDSKPFLSQEDLPNSQNFSDKSKYRHINGMYLDNFLFVLNSVLSHSDDVALFNNGDLKIIQTLQNLSLQAKKLYIRLFLRKIKWNRVSKIDYKDICEKEDICLYVNELVYAHYLLSEQSLDTLDDILSLLLKEELQILCKELKIFSSGTREILIGALSKFKLKQSTITSMFKKTPQNDNFIVKRAKELAGQCCIINRDVRSVFMRVLMLFSLPHYEEEEDGGQQSQLSTLLMVTLGKMHFPDYEIVRNKVLFRTREDVLRIEDCLHLDREAREFNELKKWDEILAVCAKSESLLEELKKDKELMHHCQSLPHFLRKFTPPSILCHSLCYAFEAHQHLKDYRSAVKLLEKLLSNEVYLQDYRGRWYDRLALNYDQHLKNPQKALCIIETAMKDLDVRVGHRLSLSVRAQRIINSKRGMKIADKLKNRISFIEYEEAPKIFVQGRTLPSDIPGYKRVFLSLDSSQNETICSVEELAKSYYRNKGYNEGVHCEGKTLKSIFCLLFWDQIYAKIPDAFRSTQQASPLDIDSDHFYEARKDMIDARLSEIEKWSDDQIGCELKRAWNTHEGTVCMVNWTIFRDIEHMQGLAISVGMKFFVPICRRLCLEHRFTRSGFPDLVLWSPQKKICRLVEVKGPNDHLSMKQILWLDFFLKIGMKAEVCHVEAVGAKRLQCLKPKEILKNGLDSSDIHCPIKDYNSSKCSPKKSSPPLKSPRSGTKMPKSTPVVTSPKIKPPSKNESEMEEFIEECDKKIKASASGDKSSNRSKRKQSDSDDEFIEIPKTMGRILRKRMKR